MRGPTPGCKRREATDVGKLWTEGEFTLEFEDPIGDLDFVERAFSVVRTRGGPKELKLPGPDNVWGFTHDGRRVQVFEKTKETD